MTEKTPMGVDFFDETYGGLFRRRACLLCGPSGSGKTVASFQFLAKGLRLQERCLMLSTQSARDLAIRADSMGLKFSEAVESGDLFLLEYTDYIPGRDQEESLMLPPDGFDQLREIIEQQAIRRVVLDSVLPWVAVPPTQHLPEHVFSFVRVFERMGIASLFTIPKPVSLAATRLYRLLEDLVPISVNLLYEPENSRRVWIVNKYVGKDNVGTETAFEIRADKGIVKAEGAGASQAPPRIVHQEVKKESPRKTATQEQDAAASKAETSQSKKPRFSSVVFGDT